VTRSTTRYQRILLVAFMVCSGLALGELAASMRASAWQTGVLAMLIGCLLFGSELFGRQYRQPAPRPRLAPLPIPLPATRFELAYRTTGRAIRTYEREAAALGFVRDIVRFGTRDDAAQFELRALYADGRSTVVADGYQLVQRALQDRVL
jgi:hypothetical protein